MVALKTATELQRKIQFLVIFCTLSQFFAPVNFRWKSYVKRAPRHCGCRFFNKPTSKFLKWKVSQKLDDKTSRFRLKKYWREIKKQKLPGFCGNSRLIWFFSESFFAEKIREMTWRTARFIRLSCGVVARWEVSQRSTTARLLRLLSLVPVSQGETTRCAEIQ